MTHTRKNIAVESRQYAYDHEGQRILKQTPNETTFYVSRNFLQTQNASVTFDTVYYYDDKGTLIASKDPTTRSIIITRTLNSFGEPLAI